MNLLKSFLSSLVLSLSVSAAALAQPAGPKAPEISFQAGSVTVDGITAQGQVVWY
jgi:hypothetical protein